MKLCGRGGGKTRTHVISVSFELVEEGARPGEGDSTGWSEVSPARFQGSIPYAVGAWDLLISWLFHYFVKISVDVFEKALLLRECFG